MVVMGLGFEGLPYAGRNGMGVLGVLGVFMYICMFIAPETLLPNAWLIVNTKRNTTGILHTKIMDNVWC